MAFTGAWGQWYEESEHPRGQGGKWTSKGGIGSDDVRPKRGPTLDSVKPLPKGISDGIDRKLDEFETSAFSQYIAWAESSKLNDYLRGLIGKDELYDPDIADPVIGKMTEVLKRTKLSQDLTVFRLVGGDFLHGLKKGDKITDKGFMSTSRARLAPKNVAWSLGSGKPTHMEISLKKGQKAFIAELHDADEANLLEVILPRKTTLVFQGKKGGVYQFTVQEGKGKKGKDPRPKDEEDYVKPEKVWSERAPDLRESDAVRERLEDIAPTTMARDALRSRIRSTLGQPRGKKGAPVDRRAEGEKIITDAGFGTIGAESLRNVGKQFNVPKEVSEDSLIFAQGIAEAVDAVKGTVLEKVLSKNRKKFAFCFADYKPKEASMSTGSGLAISRLRTDQGQSPSILFTINTAYDPNFEAGRAFAYAGVVGRRVWNETHDWKKALRAEAKVSIIHELAHAADIASGDQLTDSLVDTVMALVRKGNPIFEVPRILRKISDYAATTPKESAAEAATRYIVDGKLPGPAELNAWGKKMLTWNRERKAT